MRLLERYTVRHNPAAITRQRYVVSPRDYMQRAPQAAAGDLRFIAKHPQYTDRLFDSRGRSNPLVRYLFLPLSRIPLVSRLLPAMAVWLAQVCGNTPLRSNRLLARFFSGAYRVSYWSAVRMRGGIPKADSLLILCYHAIADQSADPVLAPYGIPPRRFAEQLESLAARGFTFVGPDALAAYLSRGAPLPRRAVLLTFDDCYADLAGVARDVLRPLGIGAIAFAVTAMESGTNEWDQPAGAERLPLLKMEDLRDLTALGIEIGSHSRTHRELPPLSDAERKDETAGSMTDIETNGLPRPRFFAYPYGARDPASGEAVREAGYLAAFSVGGGRANRNSDPFNLPRVTILATDRPWQFRLKTAAPTMFGRLAWAHHATGRRLQRIRRLVSGRR